MGHFRHFSKNKARLPRGLDVKWHIPSTCLDAAKKWFSIGFFEHKQAKCTQLPGQHVDFPNGTDFAHLRVCVWLRENGTISPLTFFSWFMVIVAQFEANPCHEVNLGLVALSLIL